MDGTSMTWYVLQYEIYYLQISYVFTLVLFSVGFEYMEYEHRNSFIITISYIGRLLLQKNILNNTDLL